MKRTVLILLMVGLLNCTCKSVILDNQFEGGHIVVQIDNNFGFDYYYMMYKGKKDIGNVPLKSLTVARVYRVNSPIDTMAALYNGTISKEISAKVPFNELEPIADLLAKFPQTTITIIEEPNTRPSKPKVILPKKKELEEMLDKENKPKVKPLVIEAGEGLPISVNMPPAVAEIAVDYVA